MHLVMSPERQKKKFWIGCLDAISMSCLLEAAKGVRALQLPSSPPIHSPQQSPAGEGHTLSSAARIAELGVFKPALGL